MQLFLELLGFLPLTAAEAAIQLSITETVCDNCVDVTGAIPLDEDEDGELDTEVVLEHVGS